MLYITHLQYEYTQVAVDLFCEKITLVHCLVAVCICYFSGILNNILKLYTVYIASGLFTQVAIFVDVFNVPRVVLSDSKNLYYHDSCYKTIPTLSTISIVIQRTKFMQHIMQSLIILHTSAEQ